MIFLTVGTQFPFNRLVRAVDEAMGQDLISDDIFGQIGESSYKPENFDAVAYLSKEQFDKCVQEASNVIGHAGIGTITIALEYNKPLLVLPRLKRYGEIVNDHQLDITRKFEHLGYLLAAYSAEELSEKINGLESFVPRKWQSQTDKVTKRISTFLNELRRLRQFTYNKSLTV